MEKIKERYGVLNGSIVGEDAENNEFERMLFED